MQGVQMTIQSVGWISATHSLFHVAAWWMRYRLPTLQYLLKTTYQALSLL